MSYRLSSSYFFFFSFFFFNDTATTEIYTLSLHDALPIFGRVGSLCAAVFCAVIGWLCWLQVRIEHGEWAEADGADRKSTRLNSSHSQISYAVFCLKKKKKIKQTRETQHVIKER